SNSCLAVFVNFIAVQQNKDTVCKRCLAGYFSDVSSSTETCKSWTNCTALGTAEKIRGTDRLDAVCEEPLISVPPRDDTKKLLYGLIVPFLLVVLIAGIVALVYCQNKGKALTVGLQHWANEICRRIKGTKDSCR
uniref:TNFR-Cys domain-containing protein n=1 Tax=Sphenodon punctatus TaxID=8508 RepID=A0A8D0GPI3_SPHPU